MDAVEYLKERERMCAASMCTTCPLAIFPICRAGEVTDPERCVSIVGKWSKENPVITNRMKFKEVFGLDEPPATTINRIELSEDGVYFDLNVWLDEEYKAP